MRIFANPVEPAPLSVRHAVGVALNLPITLLSQSGLPIDISGMNLQIVLAPRSQGRAYAYALEVDDGPGGRAHADIPGVALNDRRGANIELYSRDQDGVPTALIARGQLQPTWGGYQYAGPLGPMTVPVLVGPTGPQGEEGPMGQAGLDGAAGPTGPTGPIGPEGDPGAQGIPGNPGSAGATGAAGPAGATGPTGPAGPPTYATVSATAPASPVAGQLWYDTTTQDLKTWSGTAWVVSTANWASGGLPLTGDYSYLATVTDVSSVLANVARTFSAVNFGAAHADRQVVVVWSGRTGSQATGTPTVVIGGVTATQVVGLTGGAGAQIAMFRANVPSGSSGSVVVTINQSSSDGVIHVYRVVPRNTATPVVDSAGNFNTTTSVLVSDIAVVSGGFLVAAAIGFTEGLTRAYNGFDTPTNNYPSGPVNSRERMAFSVACNETVGTNDPGFTRGSTSGFALNVVAASFD